MKQSDLREGLLVQNVTSGEFFLVIDVEERNFRNIKTGLVTYDACLSFFEPVFYANQLATQQPKSQMVYVVSTEVYEGMEFQEDTYFGVFYNLDKARRYYKSEHKEWFTKLANRYCNEGETVSTLTVSDRECKVYADYDEKDCVRIKITAKMIQ